MIAFKREENGDFNLAVLLVGVDAIAQEIKNSVDLYLGEAIWDTENGINYFEFFTYYQGKLDPFSDPSIILLADAISKQALKIPYVSKCVLDDILFESNQLTIKYTCTINYEKNGQLLSFESKIN
jgi:hypothetical protein